MQLIRTYKEFTYTEPKMARFRHSARSLAIRTLSLRKNIANSGNWIRFPYYHHVFEDERRGFEKQLRYLRNFGEFVSVDDVCKLLAESKPLDGRYFCISFDDGYRCLHEHMMPIAASMEVPVMIYLPTDYINTDELKEEDLKLLQDNLPGNPKLLSFLSWDQCREMLQYKISFGSHTKTHANLKNLTPSEIEYELSVSKEIIEQELKEPCVHFACPWGQINVSFDPSVTTVIAQKLGYKTFVTTNRGKTQPGDDLFLLKREHLLANWGTYQLNYFFSK